MGARTWNLPRPLSHSSISLYAECPQKYKFRYIDRIPEKPKHYFSFGSSVHSALEYFYGAKSLPPPSLDEVLAYYKEHWISAGYKNQAQEEQYREDGEEILTLFYRKHAPEYHIPLFVEYQFNMEINGVPVTGKVDRVDQMPDGRFSVIDYKTGKALAKGRAGTDEQLTMYQLACEKLLGAEVCRLSFYHLPSLTEQVAERRSSALVHALEKKIVSTAEAISSQEFSPTPEEKKCFWCDYKPLCPVYKPQNTPPPAAFATEEDVSALIDRYGDLRAQSKALEEEANFLKDEIIALFEKKGYVRAFGQKYEAIRTAGERWKFPDKKKFLELLREHGLYDRVLAPSAPKVRDLLEDQDIESALREKLSALAEKVETSELRVEPL
ncbi:MAG: PD-(D/E)XK nuclease family protein [Elusimicrobia bacterium]|nr:PD-(D/E)XK nuclease family protein [Elusimicrobiota bacterium]